MSDAKDGTDAVRGKGDDGKEYTIKFRASTPPASLTDLEGRLGALEVRVASLEHVGAQLTRRLSEVGGIDLGDAPETPVVSGAKDAKRRPYQIERDALRAELDRVIHVNHGLEGDRDYLRAELERTRGELRDARRRLDVIHQCVVEQVDEA